MSVFAGLNVFGHERRKSIAFRTNKEASAATKGRVALNLPTGLTLHLIGPDSTGLFTWVPFAPVCSSLSARIRTHFDPFERKQALVCRVWFKPLFLSSVYTACFFFVPLRRKHHRGSGISYHITLSSLPCSV